MSSLAEPAAPANIPIMTPTETVVERSDRIPDALVDRPQWVLWRAEPAKVPYQARQPQRRAKVNEPATWSNFADALTMYAEWLGSSQAFSGVGYVFTANDPFVGWDLDDCVAGDDIHPQARQLIDRLGGYAEISPSMTGVKVFTTGTLNIKTTGKKTETAPWGGALEVYHRGRWFAVTGWQVT
jgi:putative DNA primase/helicase